VRTIGWIGALLVGVAASASGAPPYDRSTPMKCAIRSVMQCGDGGCVSGTAATVNLPSVITVDVGQKLIGGVATGLTVKILSVRRDSGRLMLYGADLGGAWNGQSEDSGKMSVAVVELVSGYLMFGSCDGG